MSEQTYKDITYTLTRNERKTTSIFIERDGGVSILSPKHYSQEQIEAIIESKRSWIYTSLAEWEDLNRTRVQREFVSGKVFHTWGGTIDLKLLMIKKNRYY